MKPINVTVKTYTDIYAIKQQHGILSIIYPLLATFLLKKLSVIT
jgi:hypothetical protein